MARSSKQQQARPMAELASRIATRWGGTGEEVALDKLVSELGDVQRYDVVAALKELEKAGAGTLEVGRAAHKARFTWSRKKPAIDKGSEKSATQTQVEKAAPKSSAKLETKEVEGRLELAQRVKLAAKGSSRVEAPRSQGELEHRFHLRPGFVAIVRLPADVSASEVTRFCQFLQAIPFQHGD